MKFDFNALNFEILDANTNAYPDIFINQNGVTFTKKVLDDLNYPAFVLCQLDAKTMLNKYFKEEHHTAIIKKIRLAEGATDFR